MRMPPGQEWPPSAIVTSSTPVPASHPRQRSVVTTPDVRTRGVRRHPSVRTKVVDALAHGRVGRRVGLKVLRRVAAFERDVLVREPVDVEQRHRLLRAARIGDDRRADGRDRSEPRAGVAPEPVRHHAAVGETGGVHALRVDADARADLVEHREHEADVVEVRPARETAAPAGVPCPAEAVGGDLEEPVLLRSRVPAALTSRACTGTEPAVQHDDHRDARARQRLGHEHAVRPGRVADTDLVGRLADRELGAGARAGAHGHHGRKRDEGQETPEADAVPHAGQARARHPSRCECRIRRRPRPAACRCATMDLVASRPGGRVSRSSTWRSSARGTSGLHRARCWVTPSRGDPQESATENNRRWRARSHRQG